MTYSVRILSLVATCIVAALVAGCDRPSRPDGPSNQGKVEDKPAAAMPTDEAATPAAEIVAVPDEQPAAPPTAELGQQLFAQHCAACHGEKGDGTGIAAPFLFPKPRDIRAGRFRLVSTDNNVPTREDLHAVLARGMPGSSMPPWAHLSQQERDALVDEIIQIRRDGARGSYIESLKEDEELTDEEIAEADVQAEIQEYVDDMTTPGTSTSVPDFGPPTPEAIARGKEVYAQFACIQCHGETGRGDGVQEMLDDEMLPTSPRDFSLGIFKGDHDPASLYRRIAYGMPGTPMPASSAMTPEQMVDLVHYIRSLSTEEQRQAATLNREEIVVRRVDSLPSSPDDELWAKLPPAKPRLAPMWWRNNPDPQFTVQAVHDGTTIAVRMAWQDDTADQHSLRSERFKDAAAMELIRGPEPFLGMGDMATPVDMWFWDADRQHGQRGVDEEYPLAVVDIYPFSETVPAGPELNRTGARIIDQPDVSLPARATGNQIVPTNDDSGGSSLIVGGPRTVTFRPPQSQLVRAIGSWDEGRWNVLMTRPLPVSKSTDGVPLEPGARASVAFAIWNGSQQDRNGQKAFTIWQDLVIEK